MFSLPYPVYSFLILSILGPCAHVFSEIIDYLGKAGQERTERRKRAWQTRLAGQDR